MNLKSRLTSALESLDISYESAQVDTLLDYLALLQKWNRHFNLTAIREVDRMLTYHLLDSLSVCRWITPQSHALDVGSGAGLPGIPLAVLQPRSQWVLLDSNGKKTRFMQQAIAVCDIKNVTVVKSRIEDYHADQPPDIVISRAFTSLAAFVRSVAHVTGPESVIMAMKTGFEDNETDLDSNRYRVREYDLVVPGIKEPRKLVTVKKANA